MSFNITKMDDVELWSNLKKGDPKALKTIYDLHVKDLENYCKKLTNCFTAKPR